jgi:hypothetical protein
VLSVDSRFTTKWQWLAVTGGHAGTICGEWNGETFLPLSIIQNETFHNFAFSEVTT